jgi:hypothetical protein
MKRHRCECGCHRAPRPVHCCGCLSPDPCDRTPPPRCCGQPEPPRRLGAGEPPGWHPGLLAATSPWRPGETVEERTKRFPTVLLEEVRRGSGADGPRFQPRKDEWLPYLVIRSNPGDRGRRPQTGVAWLSPDIFVTPDLHADDARPLPTRLGGLAVAGRPNTLWAHVWNLGRAPVANARVEFYWCDPSLGISRDSANLVGVAHVDADSRDTGRCHVIVKCPTTWYPTMAVGSHQCLVVRYFEPLSDPIQPPGWNPYTSRHVAQRNITVVDAASPARLILPLRLGCSAPPGRATVAVSRVALRDVPWLSVLEGRTEHHLREARPVSELIGLTAATPVTEPLRNIGGVTVDELRRLIRPQLEVDRGCEELATQLVVDVDGLSERECAAYHVTQHTAAGGITGGYTVIARGLSGREAAV